MALTTRYGYANAPVAVLGDASLGWTTLSASLAPSATALTVTSGAAFPTLVEFDVLVGLRTAGTGVWTNTELLHVTVTSGGSWTVTRSDPTLTHAVGESVQHVLTADGLTNLPGAMTDSGDMQYLASTGRTARLAAPANGSYGVTWATGVPTWVSLASYAPLVSPSFTTPTLGVATATSLTLGASGVLVGGTNLVEQRNSTAAQTFNLYNTYTDATTYERGIFSWVSNILCIGTAKGSVGGTLRAINFTFDGNNRMAVNTGGVTMNGTLLVNNNAFWGGVAVTRARTSDGTEGEADTYITNRGASATVTRTMVTYVTPLWFKRVATQAFRIAPSSGHRFLRLNGTLEAADKYLELGSDGATLMLVWDGTNYLCLSESGTINVQP